MGLWDHLLIFSGPNWEHFRFVSAGGDGFAATVASGGTLATRDAMAKGDKKDKEAMADNFSLGGRIHNGHREEDQDKV